MVEITFEAPLDGPEGVHEPNITLEVEDTEGFGVQQEVKTIKLTAEAFKISPTVTIGKEE